MFKYIILGLLVCFNKVSSLTQDQNVSENQISEIKNNVSSDFSNSEINQSTDSSNPKLTYRSNTDTHQYLIKVWLTVFMIFIIWYVLSEMLSMDYTQDSLLFAKFLTVDAK